MSSSLTVGAITFKVLVVGAFGVGKTTLIQQISEVPVVGTEVLTSGEEAAVKPTTTVGVEYGLFSIGSGAQTTTLMLFGTPGQERFADVRDVASQGIDGLIVLVGCDPATWTAGRSLHREYNPTGQIPTVAVVNQRPGEAAAPAGVSEALSLDPTRSAVAFGRVIDPNDARRFLIELLSLILDQLEVDQED